MKELQVKKQPNNEENRMKIKATKTMTHWRQDGLPFLSADIKSNFDRLTSPNSALATTQMPTV